MTEFLQIDNQLPRVRPKRTNLQQKTGTITDRPNHMVRLCTVPLGFSPTGVH